MTITKTEAEFDNHKNGENRKSNPKKKKHLTSPACFNRLPQHCRIRDPLFLGNVLQAGLVAATEQKLEVGCLHQGLGEEGKNILNEQIGGMAATACKRDA